MKKIIAATILVLALTVPVCAQDYNLLLYPVTFGSCKQYSDGGFMSSTYSMTYFAIDIYGYYTGDTGDQVEGYVYDSDGELWSYFYGHIIWNGSFSSGYIQGTLINMDDGIYTFWIDGTIKRTGIKYSITSSAGESDSWYWVGYPYYTKCASVKGYGYMQ